MILGLLVLVAVGTVCAVLRAAGAPWRDLAIIGVACGAFAWFSPLAYVVVSFTISAGALRCMR